jgi:hypothetical protein
LSTGRSPRPAAALRLRLPVVRVRRLPEARGEPWWEEGPDWPAVVVVALVGLVGAGLAGAALILELTGDAARAPVVAGALVLAVACVVATVLALGEGLYRERVVVRGRDLEVQRRGLGGGTRWRESLQAYAGLTVVDRQRRLFVRNQDRPPTGRRGPVTEFVVVLRHARDRARDVELFRAQPSLQTLRGMHALNTDPRRAGGARALAAQACEDRARSYRDALCGLSRRLGVPVLLTPPGGGTPQPVQARSLGPWLEAGGGGPLPA